MISLFSVVKKSHTTSKHNVLTQNGLRNATNRNQAIQCEQRSSITTSTYLSRQSVSITQIKTHKTSSCPARAQVAACNSKQTKVNYANDGET